MVFDDRHEGGRRLAKRLRDLADDAPVVLGMPRGGVPVAYEVARELRASLDVVVVRKVGAPHNPEYGVGAVGEGTVTLFDDERLASLGLQRDDLDEAVSSERGELEERVERYRDGRPAAPVAGRTVIVVDDGLATGVSATAAVRVLRTRDPHRIVLAVPVGPPASVERLEEVADEVVCLHAPPSFMAVGSWYRDFSQTTDDEVVELLGRRRDEARERRQVQVVTRGGVGDRDTVNLPGRLVVPATPTALVVFAHGSGSSHDSPRNNHVAAILNDAGFATLLFDLLTPVEGQVRDHVFDVQLLADRLLGATEWIRDHEPRLGELPVGFFGASTGAAAALTAAAGNDVVRAVVSRGGRPDLAGEVLADVTAPTLLVVGGDDQAVLDENRSVVQRLGGETRLGVVDGAGHLFEEPGALDEVATHATRWFARHLAEQPIELTADSEMFT